MTTSVQDQSLHKMPHFVPTGMEIGGGLLEYYIASNIYVF